MAPRWPAATREGGGGTFSSSHWVVIRASFSSRLSLFSCSKLDPPGECVLNAPKPSDFPHSTTHTHISIRTKDRARARTQQRARTHTFTHTHTHTHTHVHTCTHVPLTPCRHANIHCAHTRTHARTHTYKTVGALEHRVPHPHSFAGRPTCPPHALPVAAHAQGVHAQSRAPRHTSKQRDTSGHTRTHTHVHVHVHVHTHTYTCTHTQAEKNENRR